MWLSLLFSSFGLLRRVVCVDSSWAFLIVSSTLSHSNEHPKQQVKEKINVPLTEPTLKLLKIKINVPLTELTRQIRATRQQQSSPARFVAPSPVQPSSALIVASPSHWRSHYVPPGRVFKPLEEIEDDSLRHNLGGHRFRPSHCPNCHLTFRTERRLKEHLRPPYRTRCKDPQGRIILSYCQGLRHGFEGYKYPARGKRAILYACPSWCPDKVFFESVDDWSWQIQYLNRIVFIPPKLVSPSKNRRRYVCEACYNRL